MTNQETPVQSRITKRKKGFTLTEIAIVLGIIGLILGAIWVAAAGVYQNQRIAHANTALLRTAQGVRSLFATSSNVGTAGDITNSVILAGAVPSDLVVGTGVGATAISVFAGGTLNVLTVTAADTVFTVQMTAVPQSACIALLTTIAGNARDPGLTSVGSTTASAPVVAATAAALPVSATALATAVTPTIATAACSSPTSNPVQFEFSIK
ncbi:MAG: type II secretion system protein [Alphaproteobacteria bacterium]